MARSPRPTSKKTPPSAARKRSGRKSVRTRAPAAKTASAKAVAKPNRAAKPSREVRQGQMGLRLRRRQGRGQGRHAQPARRQGRGPGRNGEPRSAGAARLHHHDRGLHALLRQRQHVSRRSRAAGERGARRGRPRHRPDLRRQGEPAARVGALRRARVDARHDGHRAQPRAQRRDRRGAGAEIRRQALRL